MPQVFHYRTNFTTAKSVILLPCEVNGVSKNFLFDTGADFTLIQRDTATGKMGSYGGASNRKVKLGSEIINSLKIGDVDFRNTMAINGDLAGLKEQVPNFGGIIGQPIIKKANWLINYPEKVITISNADLADTSFETIKIKIEGGAPYTFISIDGIEYKVIIDFGSSSDFNLPEESKLAKSLLGKYQFEDKERERYTIGGLQTVKEKVGKVPSIKLGNLVFTDVVTTINVSSQPRIGIGFFKDCEVYIDNSKTSYRVRKSNR